MNIKNSLEENIRRGSGNVEIISDSLVASPDEVVDGQMFQLPSIPALPKLPDIPRIEVEEKIGRRSIEPNPKRRRGGPFDGPYDFQVPTLPDPPKPEQEADLWTAVVAAGLFLSPVITIPSFIAENTIKRAMDWYSLTFGIDTAS